MKVGAPKHSSPFRGREEIELSDVAASPSPRPSPGGRGRWSGVTCTCISFAERMARWLRMVLSAGRPWSARVLLEVTEPSVSPRRLAERHASIDDA